MLRGLVLCGQAVAVGGVLFALLVVRPAVAARPALAPLLRQSLAISALGAAVVGGMQLLSLAVQALGRGERAWPALLLKRFSAFALTAVGSLVVAGLALTIPYVGGVPALLGTSYGVMVLTKVAILAGLLALGAMNFFGVRRLSAASDVGCARLRRVVHVEV